MSDEKILQFDSATSHNVIVNTEKGVTSVVIDFLGLPADLETARDDYFKLQDVSKKIEKRMELLKQHIINKLGQEGNREAKIAIEVKQDGIRYLSYLQKNTKWKETVDTIIEELVPKTKHLDAENIVNGFTTSSIREKLERDESIPS